MNCGDVVEGKVIEICQDYVLIQLSCGTARLPRELLDFEACPGDELMDLVVTHVSPQGEITLQPHVDEEDEIQETPVMKGKGRGCGYLPQHPVSNSESTCIYSIQQLLDLRPRVASAIATGPSMPEMQDWSEQELSTQLQQCLRNSQLPPSWWSRVPVGMKREALQVALQAANMPAVYAMQPESIHFREALGAYDLDDVFLRDTLTQLWAGADDNPKLWSGDVPKAAEAVEWLLLRGAPASVLLPEEPESLKIRLKGLRLLGQLGPNVAAAASAAVAGCLRDPDVKGRRAAAQTLTQLGLSVTGHAPRAIPRSFAVKRLLRLLDDADPLCSEDAAWALGHLGPDACSAAAELLHGDGEAKASVQSRVCLALGVAGADAAVFAPRLLSLLQSGGDGENGHLRASAVQALGRMGLAAGEEMCSLLCYLCTEDADAGVREAACVALGLVASEVKDQANGGLLELLRVALASALDDTEPFIREAAAVALHAAVG